ncbi:hypothetical protein JG687_00006849 [Phytophthora cactorum]|uniref:Uncharacterized protein n=1 Tax=Phytophthora cactorum TaxID=29920 RepID=A0A8T1UGS3_9STRA|nr:hypothetical protein JG687_00006849 [Phytophthora cactorum]
MTPKGFEPCSSQSVGEVSAFTLSRLKVKFIKSGMIQVTASTNGIPDYRERTWENVAGMVLYYACLGIALQYLENPKRYQIHFGLCKIRKPSRLALHRMLHRFTVFLAKFGTLYVFPVLWALTIKTNFDDKLHRLVDNMSTNPKETLPAFIAVTNALDKMITLLYALCSAQALCAFQLSVYLIR